MNNTAEVHSDDNSVHFISTVNPKRYAKTMIAIIGVLILLLYITAVIYATGQEMTKGAVLAVFILTPIGLIVTLGKYVFWNLYGKEEIILSIDMLKYRRSYGIYTTQWHYVNYKPIQYNIQVVRTDLGLSIVEIGGKTVMDVPIVIFTSTVLVPTKYLQKMVRLYTQLLERNEEAMDEKSVQA